MEKYILSKKKIQCKMFILVKYKKVSNYQFPFNLTLKKSHSHVLHLVLLYIAVKFKAA